MNDKKSKTNDKKSKSNDKNAKLNFMNGNDFRKAFERCEKILEVQHLTRQQNKSLKKILMA